MTSTTTTTPRATIAGLRDAAISAACDYARAKASDTDVSHYAHECIAAIDALAAYARKLEATNAN